VAEGGQGVGDVAGVGAEVQPAEHQQALVLISGAPGLDLQAGYVPAEPPVCTSRTRLTCSHCVTHWTAHPRIARPVGLAASRGRARLPTNAAEARTAR